MDQIWLSKLNSNNPEEQMHPGLGQVGLNFSRASTEKPARRSCFLGNGCNVALGKQGNAVKLLV